MILIDVSGASAVVRKQDILTSGMVGATVVFRFDEDWNSLAKTAVFRAGKVTKDAVVEDSISEIPHEVLATPGIALEIGVYGTADEGAVVVPTVWTKTNPIKPGADPSGDESLDPSLPVWAQMQEQLNSIVKTVNGIAPDENGNVVVEGGLNDVARTSLITILRNAVFTSDQSATIAALEKALGGGGETPDVPDVPDVPDDPDVPTVTNYTITNELVNVSSSNAATSVNENASYTATLTAADGYTLDSVIVTMGGVDVTADVYADGVITISSVTGNVEIVASAVEEAKPAELVTDGLIGFWDFRNCDYSASTMKATVGDGTIVRFGGTASDDRGIVASTAFAYNPGASGSYTAFAAPMTIVGVGYNDAPSLWNNLIVSTNMPSSFANVGSITWYDSDNTAQKIPQQLIGDKTTGYKHLTITVDEDNVIKYFYNGVLVATHDPIALGLANFDRWNIASQYFGNNNRSNPATATAIYDRAITDEEVFTMYEYCKTLEVA